ncbi:MAG: hypothetical protein WCT07_03390 [Candidatus Paceibacterota bacterium]
MKMVSLESVLKKQGYFFSKEDLRKINTYYHSPEIDRSFEMEWTTFEIKKDSKPEIVMNDEHDEYMWVHVNNVLGYDLIDGESFCIQDYLNQ